MDTDDVVAALRGDEGFRKWSLSLKGWLGKDINSQVPQCLQHVIFRTIYAEACDAARGVDGTGITEFAEACYRKAKLCRDLGKSRTSQIEMFRALAFQIIAQNKDGIVKILDNIALNYYSASNYVKALEVQWEALQYPKCFARYPEAFTNSWARLVALYYRTGEYDNCHKLAKAYLAANRPRPAPVEELLRKSENALTAMKFLDNPCLSEVDALAAGMFINKNKSNAQWRDAILTFLSTARILRNEMRLTASEKCVAHAQMSDILFNTFRMYVEAANHARLAFKNAKEIRSMDEQVLALKRLGNCELELGKYGAALGTFAQLVRVLRRQRTLDEAAWACCRAALAACGDERESLAIDWICRALDYLKHCKDLCAEARWVCEEAKLFRSIERLDIVEMLLNEIISDDVAPRLNGNLIMNVFDLLSSSFRLQNKYDRANKVLDYGIALCEKKLDVAGAVWLGVNKIWICCDQDELGQATAILDVLIERVKLVDDKYIASYVADARREIADRVAKARSGALEYLLLGGGAIGTEKQRSIVESLKNGVSKEALSVCLRLGSGEDAVESQIRYAVELDRSGSHSEARRVFFDAFKFCRAHRLLKSKGKALNDYGVMLARLKKIHSARRAFKLALAYKDRFANGDRRLSTLLSLAKADLYLGKSRDWKSTADDLLLAISNESSKNSTAYVTVSALYQKAGELELARDIALRARDLAKENGYGAPEERIGVLQECADILLDQRDVKEAQIAVEQSLDMLELGRKPLRSGHFEELQRYARPGIALMLRCLFESKKNGDKALSIVNAYKGRSLLQEVGLWEMKRPHDFPADLQESEALLMRSAKLDAADDEDIQGLRNFWLALPDRWAEYRDLRLGRPLSASALLPAHVQENERVFFVAIFPTLEAVYVWLISPSGEVLEWYRREISWEMFQRTVRDVRTSICARVTLPRSWTTFSESLLKPAIRHIPRDSTICFSLSGVGLDLPLSVFRLDDEYLIERNAIANIPSLTLIPYFEGAGGIDRRSLCYLVLGDSLSDLRYANKEAQFVASDIQGHVFMREDVNRKNVESSIGECNILHVACHATFESLSPQTSGFVLSDRTLFSARDVSKFRPHGALAFLSACDTGLVHTGAGDELVGLSTAILTAGFRTVIATLWEIADAATAQLVGHFYSAVLEKNDSFGDALRGAQLKLLSIPRYSHPYFWSGFQLTGDWRTRISSKEAL
jgi:CHAT domain-containing protein